MGAHSNFAMGAMLHRDAIGIRSWSDLSDFAKI